MATSDLERMRDEWAMAWSSIDNKDPERVLALFADDCVFEDVTFGVVARGKEELRSFVNRAFAAIPDFKYGLTSRFAASQWAVIEWVMSGTHRRLPRDAGHWQALFVGAGREHPRTGGR